MAYNCSGIDCGTCIAANKGKCPALNIQLATAIEESVAMHKLTDHVDTQ